ncbi:hypothetical protein CLU97_0941 [Chryseobacterium sp. 7]|nr:hypothetical protein CLU97_0941 [Chryseobacterium sp. 7]
MKNLSYSISMVLYIIGIYIIYNYIFLFLYKICVFGINKGLIVSFILYFISIILGVLLIKYNKKILYLIIPVSKRINAQINIFEISIITFLIFELFLY